MTRKDYVALAAALKDAKPLSTRPQMRNLYGAEDETPYTVWCASVYAVSDVLGRDNTRFDRERFLTACGAGL